MSNQTTYGETQEYAWLTECLERRFPEVGDRITADLNTIGAMCRAEPKPAQVGIQTLAGHVRNLSDAQTPDEHSRLEFLRFALGAIFTVYTGIAVAEGWVEDVGMVPPELQVAVKLYPEIIECANALGSVQTR